MFSSLGFDATGLHVVAMDAFGFLPGDDPPAVALQRSGQRIRDSVAAAADTESATVVKIENKGVHGERGMLEFCGIKRQISDQHVPQQRVGDQLFQHLVDASQLILGM